MLWNMISLDDKELYKTPEKFYEWLSSLNETEMEECIYKAADGKKIHPPASYKFIPDTPQTKVQILDGYIAISSSNLKALDLNIYIIYEGKKRENSIPYGSYKW